MKTARGRLIGNVLQINERTFADLVNESGSTKGNVSQYLNGHHRSLKVGRALARLIQDAEIVAQLDQRPLRFYQDDSSTGIGRV